MSPHVPARRLLSPALVALAATTALVAGTAAAQAAPLAGATTASVGSLATSASTTRAADSAGAVDVGRASYAVPSGAVYVSPTGRRDPAAGTKAAPLRTIAKALLVAPAGLAVVLRAGMYHESVTSTKKVTIQNYPGEGVWLDGSSPVSGWKADGATWRHDNWTTRFDASVGYSKGATDGTSAGWQWVNPSYPMASSHPDQVYLDGSAPEAGVVALEGRWAARSTSDRVHVAPLHQQELLRQGGAGHHPHPGHAGGRVRARSSAASASAATRRASAGTSGP